MGLVNYCSKQSADELFAINLIAFTFNLLVLSNFFFFFFLPQTTDSNYTCDCPMGYSGRNCDQLASACSSDNPCVNGGTCIQGPSGYMCACPLGDFDEKNNCHQFTSCEQSPCKNEGTCQPGPGPGPGSYKCTCQAGFLGGNCQQNVDDCSGVSCYNGGSCRDGRNEYTCQCTVGFSGRHCQDPVDLCRGFPCANGGTCVESNGVDFQCACAPGFLGRLCNVNINECDPNPCANGGACVDRVNEFLCLCPMAFGGQTCNVQLNGSATLQAVLDMDRRSREVLFPLRYPAQKSVEENSSSDRIAQQLTTGRVVLITVLSLMVPMAALVAYIFIRCCKRRRAAKAKREYDEELARAQNEANSRAAGKKCLDIDDPVRGTMIVNSLGTTGSESFYGLSRAKSSTLSNMSQKLCKSNDYESNLISATCTSQRHLPALGLHGHGHGHHAGLASLSRAKSNLKLLNTDNVYTHLNLANNRLAKSSGKLDNATAVEHEYEVISNKPDPSYPSTYGQLKERQRVSCPESSATLNLSPFQKKRPASQYGPLYARLAVSVPNQHSPTHR